MRSSDFCSLRPSAGAAFIAGLFLAAGAIAGPIDVMFSNIASHPSSIIPGGGGLLFDAGTGTQFDRIFISPDGSRFIFLAQAELGASEVDNELIVLGTFNPFTANMVVKEGNPVSFEPTINYGTFIRTQLSINNAGQFAFTADTTAATGADEMGIVFDGTNFVPVQREGSPAPFGGTWGSVNSDANILANGDYAGRASTFTGATARQLIHLNGVILAETDITSPPGQLVMPFQTLDVITATDRFRMSKDGDWIAHADLNGPTATDLVMLLNGTVVAQEGAPLPGSSFVSPVLNLSTDAGSNLISHNGDHHAFRGSNADAQDWVVFNGNVVAKTDDPIIPMSTETYDDAIFTATFFNIALNGVGDYVIGGVTNAANVSANAVLVLNGTRVIAREGDPVDLNGNGIDDDDLYISVFNNDDSALSDDLKYYFMADLRNGAGTTVGQAILMMDLDPPAGCVADVDDGTGSGTPDGGVTIEDLLYYLLIFDAGDVGADVDDGSGTGTPDGGVTIEDLLYFLLRFDLGC